MRGMKPEDCDCCIAGGGPAGILLGYLLARAGGRVTILEKHADFFRDFRGDTVHPSTLQLLAELGLFERFQTLPQQRVQTLSLRIGERVQPVIDFRGLRPFDYLALVPQWDFLDFLARAGRAFPGFDLRMEHRVTGLIETGGVVRGLRYAAPGGEGEIRARLVVGCDGRHSAVRKDSGLPLAAYGAPMDVLWFRLARTAGDPEETFASIGSGRMMVLLNRGDYWQCGYLVPKGGATVLTAGPLTPLQEGIRSLAPFLGDRVATLTDPAAVSLLEVRVDALQRWYRPGLLLLGDAAHAMSPIGGVGINLALQDAVAAANRLAPILLTDGPVPLAVLAAIEQRRRLPTRLTQRLQLLLQRRVITAVLAPDKTPRIPPLLRLLLRFRSVRQIPARLFGYGIRPEHVASHIVNGL